MAEAGHVHAVLAQRVLPRDPDAALTVIADLLHTPDGPPIAPWPGTVPPVAELCQRGDDTWVLDPGHRFHMDNTCDHVRVLGRIFAPIAPAEPDVVQRHVATAMQEVDDLERSGRDSQARALADGLAHMLSGTKVVSQVDPLIRLVIGLVPVDHARAYVRSGLDYDAAIAIERAGTFDADALDTLTALTRDMTG